MPERWQTAGFGLYIHWPFCAAKCPYCDFNSHVASTIEQDRWRRAYLSEIDRVGAVTGGRVLSTVFFGGGTPSLMDPELVGAVLEKARDTWSMANDLEVTLEANPTSVESSRFRGFRDAGVNRVSVGVQALNDDDLRALGRLHSVDEAMRAVELAHDIFPRVSFDLIYARQFQSLGDWRAELRRALALEPGHLSLYQLTIEDGTAFGDRFRRGRLPGLPDDDLGADLFEATQELCEAAGIPAYEVSNHARPGAECRHNLIYWRSGDWAGIGPGAHGRLTLAGQRIGVETELSPATWLRSVETRGSGETGRCVLTAEDVFAERLLMGLRLAEGVKIEKADPEFIKQIQLLNESDLVEFSDGRLRVTARGRPLLNAILRELLAGAETG